MRSGYPTTAAFNEDTHGLAGIVSRLAARAGGLALLAAAAFAVASLATWSVADPSFSHATDAPATNAMGYAGAVFSDLAMQFLGLASVAALAPGVIWGVLLTSGRTLDRLPRRGAAWFGTALAATAMAGCLPSPATWPLPTGLGGVIGDMVLSVPGWFLGGYPQGLAGVIVALVVAVPGSWLFLFAAGLTDRRVPLTSARRRQAAHAPAPETEDDDEDEESGGMLALGALAHWWLSLRAFVRRSFGRQQPAPLQRPWRNIPMDEEDDAFWPEAERRGEPGAAGPAAGAGGQHPGGGGGRRFRPGGRARGRAGGGGPPRGRRRAPGARRAAVFRRRLRRAALRPRRGCGFRAAAAPRRRAVARPRRQSGAAPAARRARPA